MTKARKIDENRIGRHVIQLWDRGNGEWVIFESVAPSNNNPCFSEPREYSWVYYTEADARESYAREISSVRRGYVRLCCGV